MDMTVNTASEASLELTVLRAVPCEAHDEYLAECPDCLSGEEAQARGVSQTSEDLGVVGYWSRDGLKGDLWKKLRRR